MGVIIYLILLSIYIFIPIILTIGSELIMLKLLGLKEKEIYKNLLVISIITDIIFSIVLFLTNKTYKEFGIFYLLLLLLIVILIEYFWLKMNIENKKLPLFKLSIIVNSIAFIVGMYSFGLLTGAILWNF